MMLCNIIARKKRQLSMTILCQHSIVTSWDVGIEDHSTIHCLHIVCLQSKFILCVFRVENVNFLSSSDHWVKMGIKNISKSKGEYQFPEQPVQRFNEEGIQSPIQMVLVKPGLTVVKDGYKVRYEPSLSYHPGVTGLVWEETQTLPCTL